MTAPALLITQCLQVDFVKPIGKHEPLPNKLHVGADEARRLLGDRPEDGPLARTVRWAQEQGPDRLGVIHIRDWHNPDDPSQQDHLRQFGAHCLRNTPGAGFVFPAPPANRPDIAVVDSLTLNDFNGTTLQGRLAPWAGQPTRVGLLGVWTEAKITYLAYELKTRYPTFRIGVCSALTASSSRAHHFMALDQLQRLLGVEIFSSVGAFVRFLGGRDEDWPWESPADRGAASFTGVDNLSATDRDLLKYLFRDSRRADFKVLDGGYSGNVVLAAESEDLHGHRQAPHVVKIGPQVPMGQEREAFEKVESVLGNNAPHIDEFADFGDRGAIKYRYAAMGGGFSTTFQKKYAAGLAPEKTRYYLNQVFREQLGRFYRAAELEKCNLLSYYQYDLPGLGARIRPRVEAVYGAPAAGDALRFSNGVSFYNPCRFYDDDLPTLLPLADASARWSYVHGDLNGANILIDGQDNVWLIDFFHTHRGHVLRDLAKFENDLLYIFTEVKSPAEFDQALRLTDHLMAVEDLARPPADLPADITHPPLRRTFETLRVLRSFYPELIQAHRDPLQLHIAQLRYAAHTLSFDESNDFQKRWALYTGARCAERIKTSLLRTGPLRIDWIDPRWTASGALGLTILPGRRDVGRSLADDVAALKSQGVTDVVCLVPEDELRRYGVPGLLAEYRKAGLRVHHWPVLDQKTTSPAEMEKIVADVGGRLDAGARVAVHCVGGLGRSGLVAACFLKSRGASTDEAIVEVRRVRSPRAVESAVQEQFVTNFHPR
ncbi:MAG TPA: phosphotransferase [Elusimicrobiota bacterium]|nr:phosphotransferase [Elusimicrobiota bacterium]